MKRFVILLSLGLYAIAGPIKPIPLKPDCDIKKAKVGKILFFDPILSRDKTVSCNSCHDLNKGGADNKRVSIGVRGQKGKLNSPTVFNAVFNFRQFWNGRAKDLSQQADEVLHNPIEMDMTKELIEKRLNANKFYKKLFKNAFDTDYITYEMVIKAIVEFEKALITPNSKFDKYLKGETSLSKAEYQGYLLFKKIGCITCHNGINIGANSFQKMGLIVPYEGPAIGDRYEVTKNPKDRYVYKVPTLRNIALTAPYFHDGSAKTLKEAIDSVGCHNLGLSLSKKETELIEKFLKTLTGEKPEILKEDE